MNEQPAEKPLSGGELVIVAIILVILFAILAPQYSRASTEQQVDMPAALRTMRTKISIYRAQHDSSLPLIFYSGASVIDGEAVWSELNNSTPAVNPLNGLSSVCLIDSASTDFADGADVTTPSRGNRPAPGKVGWIVNTETGRLWATAANARLVFNESDPSAAGNFAPTN